VNAFVLAGGLGTRLRSRWGDLPKALAPLRGRPFLLHVLEWLAENGVRETVLCLGHGAQQVRDALRDGVSGMTLQFSVEDRPLGTGGALWLARAHARGSALVINGDTLPGCAPWAVERTRWEHGAACALGLFHVDDARARGRVELDHLDRVTAFAEKDEAHTGGAWVNGGLYAFSSALWRSLPAGPSSLERDVLPGWAARGWLAGHRCSGRFFDIGTPEDWERAEREWSGPVAHGGSA
jgi:NDP-sugar pyrophosphorylase family protein